MDELSTELGNALDAGTSQDELTQNAETLTETTGSEIIESSQDVDNQPYWATHENAKKGFWKTEQDVINGYDYYDKKFKPIETVLSQRGIKDPDGLTEIFSKYDEYSDPKSEINTSYNALQNLLNHPTYGQEFTGFINGIVEKAEMEKYGAMLPKEVKQQLQEVEELKQWRQDQEHQVKVQEFNGKLDETCDKIESFCAEKGIELGEDDLKNHLQNCLKNNISIDRVFENFVTENLDKILGNVQSKASKAVVNNLSSNSKSAIATSAISKTISSQGPSTNSIGELKDAIGNALTN